MFHSFLETMALVEFGDFDLIDNGFNKTSFINTPELAAVNVSQLMLDVSNQQIQSANSLVELE
jgi:hypothetical protein